MYYMDHAQLLQSSREHLALADHILYTSYPLLQDPKLLSAALQAVFIAASRSANVLIGNLDLPFKQRLKAFRQAVQKNELRSDYVNLLSDLGAQVKRVQTTSTLFRRKQKLIILHDDKPHEMTIDQIRDFSFRTKSLIADIIEYTNG